MIVTVFSEFPGIGPEAPCGNLQIRKAKARYRSTVQMSETLTDLTLEISLLREILPVLQRS